MIRACRSCGCTDDRACVVEGIACHWISYDLCSACDAPDLCGRPARSTRRNSLILAAACVDLDEIPADGVDDACSRCPGEGVIPAGDQIWWDPTSEDGESEKMCRRHAFAYARWPQTYMRGVRRARPWTGADLRMIQLRMIR